MAKNIKKNKGPGKRAKRRLRRENQEFFSFKKKSEFTFYGKKIDEIKKMNIEEFLVLAPSRIRRTIKRGFNHKQEKFLSKVRDAKEPVEGVKQKIIKTHCRDMPIVPVMLGKMVGVHNGRQYVEVLIKPEMLGHYVGEFALTRKVVSHGSPGIGATKSSLAVATRK